MARTGSALILLVAAVVSVPALAATAEPEFYMTADRTKVGTEEAFRLDVVVGNAPEGSSLTFPATKDFEILNRSESTQMSYSMGTGGSGVIKQIRRYTLTMRANRPGKLTIPPAVLKSPDRSYKTEAITIEAVPGRTRDDRADRRAQQQQRNPFGFPGGLPPGFPPGFGQLDDDPFEEPEPSGGVDDDVNIPRGDSDLFVKASLDKTEAFVGEQVMFTLTIYSRLDLASVDTVTMPKLEGFWTQDIQSPAQLSAVQKIINGIPYRAYVLRQKAMFPMKPGDVAIEAAEVDINTGIVFATRRAHRVSNALKLKIKPLPGNPATSNVGHWVLSATTAQTTVTLGDPIPVTVVLEGRGHLQGVQVPALEVPQGLKKFDPQTSDEQKVTRSGVVTGKRTIEYVMVPQQTGTFTLPGLTMPYFDPESKHFEEAKTEPIQITVKPGAGGQVAMTPSTTGTPTADSPMKNQLVGGGIRQVRTSASFKKVSPPLWSRGFFVPMAAAPIVLSLALLGIGLVRSSIAKTSPEAMKKAQAKAARKRLAAAEQLLASASSTAFYEEVDRALRSFLEAKLNTPLSGLTRDALDQVMAAQNVPPNERARVLAVFETCDLGRYAPGMGEASARNRALDDAAAAMEKWA